MARLTGDRSEHTRDWFDEQLDAFKWRNAERAKPDYSLEYSNVLGEDVQNARSRYLESMAEAEQQQTRQRFGRSSD